MDEVMSAIDAYNEVHEKMIENDIDLDDSGTLKDALALLRSVAERYESETHR